MILKLLKLVRCYYCNSILPEFLANKRRIKESNKNIFGVVVNMCDECDNYLDEFRSIL
jgi:RNase P subunit RPR2